MDCRHFDADTLYTCAAYPDGIPIPILSGDIQHDQPLSGDKGTQFEATVIRAQALDSQDSDIVDLISTSYGKPIDALLSAPRIDAEVVSGLFRDGYTVVAYRFDNSFLSLETWDKDKSQSFLRGYYAPELSPYLPNAYAMGLVDAAIAKDSRTDSVLLNDDNTPKLTKSTISLDPLSRKLVKKIKLKRKNRDTSSRL